MTITEQKPSINRPLTPLWVISLFISLTEVTLTVAVVQTSNGIQVALTSFVIIFPILIAVAFFAVLWFKPHHFYSPAEYGQQSSVKDYVEAITQRKSLDESQLYSTIQNTVRSTITSQEIIGELSKIASQQTGKQVQKEITQILETAVDKVVESIREESFLTVDSRPLLGKTGVVWQIPYDRFSNISDLLDDVWVSLAEASNDKILPFTYNEKWVLRDSKTGKIFRDMHRQWAHKHNQSRDIRPLKDVGIVAGMKLEIVTVK